MDLKIREYDVVEYLQTPEDIFYYLEAELGQGEAPYMAKAQSDVARARGGVGRLSEESGVRVDVLEAAIAAEHELPIETVVQVMEAFRPSSEAKVA